MFKKSSKRNFRLRKVSEEDIGDNPATGDAANGFSIAAVKAKQKKQKGEKKQLGTSKPEKKAVLSFGGSDDDEGDESNIFQLKKPSRSRRIAKHIKMLAQEEREQSQIPGGEYTKERLQELKKLSTEPQSLGSSSPFRSLDNFSARDAVDFDQFGAAVNGGMMELRLGEIPDANRIHAARKQREMMRKYGADYIPVENTDTYKSKSASRLVRDDAEDGSSEDEGSSIQMKGIIDDAQRVANEIGSEGESAFHQDEEFDLWEAEMIKKGISTQQPGKLTEEDQIVGSNAPVQNSSFYSNGTFEALPPKNTVNSVPKAATNATETVTIVRKRIFDRLERLREVNCSHKQDRERAKLDVEESEKSTVCLADITSISTQYTYFQDMKAYVGDLIDCLREKNVEIEALEKRRYAIWKGRADRITARRQQDVRDESSDITSALSNVKIAATPIDKEKQTRIREREARRSRRRSARERTGNLKSHIDGTSTDEEETSTDKLAWETELEKITSLEQSLFEDVVEEFYCVKVVLSKFETWKTTQPESYNDAYIGLCLPKLLAPFIRLAMLHWNPLEADATPFEDMQWFQDLLFYGVGKDSHNCDGAKGDPDTKVIAGIFDKVILPKLTYLARDIWDPLSSKQSRRLSLSLFKMVGTYPCFRPGNRRCNELLTALCTRVQSSLDGDIFIPLYHPSALTNISSGPGAFFERQTWTCIKLFENILLFDNVLSQDTLEELAFTLLLNRYIMLSLQSSPVTTVSVHKCQRIADAIPPHWLKDSEVLVTHLQALSRYLVYSARHIHQQVSTCSAKEKWKARSCIAQLSKILSRIGANDMSQDVFQFLDGRPFV